MREENVASACVPGIGSGFDAVEIASKENRPAAVVTGKDHGLSARRHRKMDSGLVQIEPGSANMGYHRPGRLRLRRPACKHRGHEHGNARPGCGPRNRSPQRARRAAPCMAGVSSPGASSISMRATAAESSRRFGSFSRQRHEQPANRRRRLHREQLPIRLVLEDDHEHVRRRFTVKGTPPGECSRTARTRTPRCPHVCRQAFPRTCSGAMYAAVPNRSARPGHPGG